MQTNAISVCFRTPRRWKSLTKASQTPAALLGVLTNRKSVILRIDGPEHAPLFLAGLYMFGTRRPRDASGPR